MMRQAYVGLALLFVSSIALATVPMGGLTGERLRGTSGVKQAQAIPIQKLVNETRSPTARTVLAVGGAVPSVLPQAVETDISRGLLVGQSSAVVHEDPVLQPVQGPAAIVEIEPKGVSATVEEIETTDAGVAGLDDPSVGDEAESAEYERLFGADTELSAGKPVEMESDLSLWIWPALLLGIMATWWLKKRLDKGEGPDDGIQIVGRASLGRDGSLAVVEVQDSDGQPRRLLVGYGGGAPRLVADLAETQASLISTEGRGPGGRKGDSANWDRAFQDADEDINSRSTGNQLIADVLADRDEARKSLGELPKGGGRPGVRRRAYRGTMA